MSSSRNRRASLLSVGGVAICGTIAVVSMGSAASAGGPTCNSKPVTIIGGIYVYGTDGDDVILGGVNTHGLGTHVFAGAGNDTICTFDAPDVIFGDEGDDVIVGAGGDDTISGGPGIDSLRGGPGHDRIEGGPDHDHIVGGPGLDTLVFASSPGAVRVDLQGYQAVAADGTDSFYEVESVVGSNFDDVLWGTAGPNRIRGDGGNDQIFGRGGNDDLDGEFGDDVIDGGPGIDWVHYVRADRVDVDLLAHSATGITGGTSESDALTTIEHVEGSLGDDTLRGDSGRNWLVGGPGSNVLIGRAGNDFLFGNPDAVDSFDGGPGYDACDLGDGDGFISCEQ